MHLFLYKKTLLRYLSLFLFCLVVMLLTTNPTYAQRKKHKKSKKQKTQQQQDDNSKVDYYNPNVLQYQDYVYKDNIKTVKLHLLNRPLSEPFLQLGGKEFLELTFDELGEEEQYFSYTLVHCTADWQASDIDPFDYLDGFTRDDISQYEYSINTLQSYTHYHLVLPNQNMKITKSGNYLLKVYANDDPEELVLTRRFSVYENILNVDARFQSSNLEAFFNTHQQLNFDINYKGINVGNPMEEIKVCVLQNGRWDNALTQLKPVFMRDQLLVYNYVDKNLFEGGNEFRYFDTRSLMHYSERIKKVQQEDENHIILYPDVSRQNNGRHLIRVNYRDINGKFRIGIHDGIFTDLDADYAYVHFSLPTETPISDGNLYIFGGLSDWRIQENFQMKYNYKKKSYEGIVYLKQGLYDYQYAIIRDGTHEKDTSFLEGNYYNTENNYFVLVYHRAFAARYDRLISIKHLNTMY